MAGESDSPIWSRFTRLFKSHSEDAVEQAILNAREDGDIEPEEGSMLLNILHLDDVQVQDIMTPRTDIICEEISHPLSAVISRIVETGHSRVPIYKETRDNIVGVAFAKDVLRALYTPNPIEADKPGTIASIMRPPFFVPETKNVQKLLEEFRSRKNHMAIAIDEYGGTSGLVTIEDVLELIVGDIEDEHDAPREEDIRPIEGGALLLTGRALLEDLEEWGVRFTSDEVDTIGGYITMKLGHVPRPGEEAELDGWTFSILEADAKRIHKIRAERRAPAPAEDAANQ